LLQETLKSMLEKRVGRKRRQIFISIWFCERSTSLPFL